MKKFILAIVTLFCAAAAHAQLPKLVEKNLQEAEVGLTLKPGLTLTGIPTYKTYFRSSNALNSGDSLNVALPITTGVSGMAELWLLKAPNIGYAYSMEYGLGWLFTQSHQISDRGHSLYLGTEKIRLTLDFRKINRFAYGQVYENLAISSPETYIRNNSEYRDIKRFAIGTYFNVGGNTFLGGKFIRERFSWIDNRYFSPEITSAKGFEFSVFDPDEFALKFELFLGTPVSGFAYTVPDYERVEKQYYYFNLALQRPLNFSLLKYKEVIR